MTMQYTKEALEKATARVKAHPERGQKIFSSRAVVTDSTRCQVYDGDKIMAFDLPGAMGGNGTDPTPGTIFRAALASCVAMGVKMWAAREDLEIDQVDVRIEADSDARGQFGLDDTIAVGYTGMRLYVDVQSDAPEDKVQQVIEASLKYSPLLDVVVHAQKLDTRIAVSAA